MSFGQNISKPCPSPSFELFFVKFVFHFLANHSYLYAGMTSHFCTVSVYGVEDKFYNPGSDIKLRQPIQRQRQPKRRQLAMCDSTCDINGKHHYQNQQLSHQSRRQTCTRNRSPKPSIQHAHNAQYVFFRGNVAATLTTLER